MSVDDDDDYHHSTELDEYTADGEGEEEEQQEQEHDILLLHAHDVINPLKFAYSPSSSSPASSTKPSYYDQHNSNTTTTSHDGKKDTTASSIIASKQGAPEKRWRLVFRAVCILGAGCLGMMVCYVLRLLMRMESGNLHMRCSNIVLSEFANLRLDCLFFLALELISFVCLFGIHIGFWYTIWSFIVF